MSENQSRHANRWLHGLKGLEVGGSAHNQFGLDTLNVDYTDAVTDYKEAEMVMCGKMLPVDIVGWAWNIPVDDKSYDFVISSHVIEHIWDPIATLEEWKRIARQYIYIICPQRDATHADADKELTSLKEIKHRHCYPVAQLEDLGHVCRWTCSSFIEMCKEYGFYVVDYLDPDDKVGNGFAVVIDIKAS